jgi:hypothetical protein
MEHPPVLQTLPADVWPAIFAFLPPRETIVQCARVCVLWRALVRRSACYTNHELSIDNDLLWRRNDEYDYSGFARLCEDGAFARLTALEFKLSKHRPLLAEADLLHLDRLPRLNKLSLIDTGAAVSDSTIEMISRLPNLQDLNLFEARDVTNAGLAHLAKLTELHSLVLSSDGRFNIDGLRHLAPLGASLRKLVLSSPNGWVSLFVDPAAMELIVTQFPSLNYLWLSSTGPASGLMGDLLPWQQGFDSLSRLPLIHLSLREAAVIDDGVRLIGRITTLRSLDLSLMHFITGAGLAHLRNLVNLEWLDVSSWEELRYVNHRLPDAA